MGTEIKRNLSADEIDKLNNLNGVNTGDEVSEYANLASFPAIGTSELLYIAQDTNILYRWDGASYVTVGDGGGSPTNLSIGTKTATTLGITSDGGVDDVILPEVTITEAGLLSATDKVKLNGIASGATANDTDANLKNRANHTGTQTASTISDFNVAVSSNSDVTANTNKVSASGSIDTHSDVDTTGKADGNLLSWNNTSGLWVPVAPSGGSSFTDYPEIAEPANPSADTLRLYAIDSNGVTILKGKDSTGRNWVFARDNFIVVRNNTGSLITKGSVVKISGSQGNIPTIAKAQADSLDNLPGAGITTEDIANNGTGTILLSGLISGVDTSSWTEGTQLYISSTSPGEFTGTKPISLAQSIGIVTNSHASNGSIDVHFEQILNGSLDVTIKELARLPAPVGGVITLADNTVYKIEGSINLGTNRIVTGVNTRLYGSSVTRDSLVYTGTGDMFTITDNTFSCSNLTLVATGAGSKVFNATNAGKDENFILFQCVIANSIECGLIDGFDNVLIDIISIINTSEGFDFKNANNLNLVNLNLSSTLAGTKIDIQAGTMDSFSIRNVLFNCAAGQTGLRIDSPNITLSRNGSVVGCNFGGAGTRTSVFTVNNSNYLVEANVGLADFVAEAAMTMIGNTTANNNVSASTWTKVEGTTTGDVLQRFSMPQSNRLTYTGQESREFHIDINLAVKYTTGSARLMEIAVFKNGVLLPGSQNALSVYASEEPVSTAAVVTMGPNDYIEVYFQKFGGPASESYLFSYLNVQIN